MWTAGFETTTWSLLIVATLIGAGAGLISGLVGVGGGIVIIPLLSMLLHFDQHTAQGTTLLVFSLPILIPAALNYKKEGRLDIPVALAIAVGILSTGYFVGKWAQGLDKVLLRKIFSVFLRFSH
ncbi:MAG: sulfite exporter TauE/SafE family protein [Candidatus Bathyarchaeia archaeon]